MAEETTIKYNKPFKFVLRNLLPNMPKVENANKLLEQDYLLTNLTSKELESVDSNTFGYNIEKSELIQKALILNQPPYSAAHFDFTIDRKVSYDQIFNIQSKLAMLNDPTLNYMLMTGGEGMANAVGGLTGGVLTAMGGKGSDKGFDFSDSSDAMATMGATVANIGQFTQVVAKTVGGASEKLTKAAKDFASGFVSTTEAEKRIFFGQKDQTAQEVGKNIQAFTLASVFTAKIVKSVEGSWPSVTLHIRHVAEKSVDEHIPIINFLQKLITPLTLAAPIYPVELVIIPSGENKGNTQLPDSLKIVDYHNGIAPFSYTQQNVGYFNITNIKIDDLKMGYGQTDSVFYNNSGMPIPLGLDVTVILEAFDPYYYNFFDPGSVYGKGNFNNDDETNLNVKIDKDGEYSS